MELGGIISEYNDIKEAGTQKVRFRDMLKKVNGLSTKKPLST